MVVLEWFNALSWDRFKGVVGVVIEELQNKNYNAYVGCDEGRLNMDA